MGNIDKIATKFTKKADLQKYCDEQFKQINELSKKLSNLKQENKELTQKLTEFECDKSIKLDNNDVETICLTQLDLLKKKALLDELSMEEAKKVDIYLKCLITMKNDPKKIEIKTKSMTTKDLLKTLDLDDLKQ